MKRIKIQYLDFWNGFHPEVYKFHEILSRHYNIVICKDPDYIIGSMYFKNALKKDAIRIFYSGENFIPDFNIYDYAVGFDQINFQDRYAFCPNYLINDRYKEDIEKMIHKHETESIAEKKKTDFCSFVVSNAFGDDIRKDFFLALSEYKKVNSGGRFMNNTGCLDGVKDKYAFQAAHKFSICFENASYKGYTTEKLVQGFAAGTIPIYWGDPCVTDVFNEKAMIILKDRRDFKSVIERIKELDQDPVAYMEMLRQPALLNAEFISQCMDGLEKFLLHIFEQPLEEARRRPHSAMVRAYYDSWFKIEKAGIQSKIKRFLR